MQIVIDIPDEQIKKSLEESKYTHEDEGEKGFVNIAMLYTNARLEFVDVERKTDFYSCKYKILPKGHGRLGDLSKIYDRLNDAQIEKTAEYKGLGEAKQIICDAPTIIEADEAESEDKE